MRLRHAVLHDRTTVDIAQCEDEDECEDECEYPATGPSRPGCKLRAPPSWARLEEEEAEDGPGGGGGPGQRGTRGGARRRQRQREREPRQRGAS